MLSIVVQCVWIKMLMISIVVQSNGIRLCAMHWDSIAYVQISFAIIGKALLTISVVTKDIGIVLLIISMVVQCVE